MAHVTVSGHSEYYWIVCKQCGYKSQDSWLVEHAEKLKQLHVNMKECQSEMIVLTQNPNEVDLVSKQTSEESVSDEPQKPPIMPKIESKSWLYDCLEFAKNTIVEHHRHYDGTDDCDLDSFFRRSTFELFIQKDKPHAYGYVDLNHGDFFAIGINHLLSERTPENEKMVNIVVVHELLHAIHPDWGHNKINPEERKLANIVCHYDALHNMEILYLSGKMRFCDE